MSEKFIGSSSERCDGVDHGVTAERAKVLAQEAISFNSNLNLNSTDSHGQTHLTEAQKTGAAFWHELVTLPIGERKLLVGLARTENQKIATSDPSMPVLSIDIDSSAFLNKVEVKYPVPFSLNKDGSPKEFIKMNLTYQGSGMCAEFGPPGPFSVGRW